MHFGTFYLDQEKDIIIDLTMLDGELTYVLRTPYHKSGNLITNLARVCGLPLSIDEKTGLKIIRGRVPCYIDADNRSVYILRLGDTKVANIHPDGTMERKATLPAIAKTLMSQTKDYRLDIRQTLVKSYIRSEVKFRSDLHAHMNANLPPDLLIALGIRHQIRYPLYYIKKLGLRLTPEQAHTLARRRERTALSFRDSPLQGKYLERRIDDHTFINFAGLILENKENAAYNIPRIRASLAILKDGQAVFSNLEKVYLYRYVFTKGEPAEDQMIPPPDASGLQDAEILRYLTQMDRDRSHPVFGTNTLFEDLLLWIGRNFSRYGVRYAEISDTTLLKADQAQPFLGQVHRVMPTVTEETGVLIRFLAPFRRIPLTIIKDQPTSSDLEGQLQVFRTVIGDPYVAGSDIIGEEMNDIRELRPLLKALTRIAGTVPGYVMRIHAGENDSLRSNVYHSVRLIRESLSPGQAMPQLRIGHGLYTENLHSEKGRRLLDTLKASGAVLEFQITSNVRLNNLSVLSNHPLKEYLKNGIPCVQGTDGAGIYGTNSIDEQLSLERMLHLTYDEMLQMRRTEDGVMQAAVTAFREKSALYEARSGSWPALPEQADPLLSPEKSKKALSDSTSCLADRIRPLPEDLIPVIIAGGSFGSANHRTRMREDVCRLIDLMLDRLDPDKVCFVIGDSLTGYEKYVADQSKGRFPVFAFVPSLVSPGQLKRLRDSGLFIRVSIESASLGLYKSFSYEIFKRRPSVLLALDGHSACANLIQEAKNGKKKAIIFGDSRCLTVRKKADSLEGYVRLFRNGPDALADILDAVGTARSISIL